MKPPACPKPTATPCPRCGGTGIDPKAATIDACPICTREAEIEFATYVATLGRPRAAA